MFFNSIIIILSYDIWFYISHMILHTNQFYHIHKIHHSKKYDNLEYLDTYNSHIYEILFQGISVFFPYIYISFNINSFILSLLFLNIRGCMRHDDNFSWLVGNHHILHHKDGRYNFGEYWIDHLFNTIYPNKEEYKKSILI